jgi:hypothetical protein
MRLRALLVSLLLFVAPGAFAQVSITSGSGTLTQGSTYTLTGTGFGSHGDYGGSQTFINRAWNPFTTALEAGNWQFDGLAQNPNNLILSTSSPLGGTATQFYRRRNVNNSNAERQGSLTVFTSSNTGVWYNSFWYRESGGNTLAHGDGTKMFRHYFGTSPRDFYFGPYFENTTEASGIYGGHDGRFSGTSAFGLGFTNYPQDEWLRVEVTEYTRGGTSVFGSDDYLEAWLTWPGHGRERLMRRGSQLPNNPVPAEGTNANEHDKWIDDDISTTDADGHTAGDLGSLYGSAPPGTGSGGHMDFAEAYQDYTIARVELCDAATHSGSSYCFTQPLLNWTSTQVQFSVNLGNLTPTTVYAHVINANNEINATGFPVGGGGAPASPKRLRLHVVLETYGLPVFALAAFGGARLLRRKHA